MSQRLNFNSLVVLLGSQDISNFQILLCSQRDFRFTHSPNSTTKLCILTRTLALTEIHTHSADSSLDVPIVAANLKKSLINSILAKVAALTILPKKIMNALSRKGRSRSKREISKPRPTIEADSQSREPFVNVGLQRWEIQRAEWTTKNPDYVPKRTPRPPPAQRDADAEELYASLLTPNYQPLPRHVPLGELIVILQEVRELIG